MSSFPPPGLLGVAALALGAFAAVRVIQLTVAGFALTQWAALAPWIAAVLGLALAHAARKVASRRHLTTPLTAGVGFWLCAGSLAASLVVPWVTVLV